MDDFTIIGPNILFFYWVLLKEGYCASTNNFTNYKILNKDDFTIEIIKAKKVFFLYFSCKFITLSTKLRFNKVVNNIKIGL